ncbi:aminoacyl--tRNA ligase-related protein [Streptomyces sp. NPDC101062]|uniref:aminoacyl--tRNA ligase-related protein n=1 Tax=unclassified Streptomyces TaxID=2593676 RepID=UPI0038304953
MTTLHDHRKLGRGLNLFDTDPLIGAGLPYWLPDGATVRHALEEYIRAAERRAGYQHVYSPMLGKRELYEISGHWAHYSDDMFPPMDIGGGQVVLRPSLCPHHAIIYRSRSHSYRDLPLRMAELGGMYRSELSGVLGGLTRVRAIQLNDAHIFCTLDQVAEEAQAALEMIRRAYEALDITATRYRLSLPGPGGKYVAAPEKWQRSTALLTDVLDRSGLPYESAEREAAFYGPKIDIQVTDGTGRESTLSTVQVDFHQPEQFDLHYIGADGAKHRPVMVHRSIIGSGSSSSPSTPTSTTGSGCWRNTCPKQSRSTTHEPSRSTAWPGCWEAPASKASASRTTAPTDSSPPSGADPMHTSTWKCGAVSRCPPRPATKSSSRAWPGCQTTCPSAGGTNAMPTCSTAKPSMLATGCSWPTCRTRRAA